LERKTVLEILLKIVCVLSGVLEKTGLHACNSKGYGEEFEENN